MNNIKYENQVKLLLDIANYINWEKCFALKGGTAINFFYEDMPRISVDIDLVYLPLKERSEAFSEMIHELDNLKNGLNILGFKVIRDSISNNNPIGKIKISNNVSSIKIEPNNVLRGAFLPPEEKSLCRKAQKVFNKDVILTCLAHDELYAGKLTAMLGRQHPRDIFDMMQFIKKYNSVKSLMDLFIAYVLQGNRPFSELLNPNLIDIKELYLNSFIGMTEKEIKLDELLEYRKKIINKVQTNLSDPQKEIILSFMELKPKLELLPFKNLAHFPGIQWKLSNIKKMPEQKRILEINKLKDIFNNPF
jgi:predicted nucleotidyltransferase component of viral defense system